MVSASNAPPYAIFNDNGELSAGISKDLLEKLAERTNLTLQYLSIPRGRVEQWLAKDEADIACFLNPAWLESPTALDWSMKLSDTKQIFIRHLSSPPIKSPADLLGKRVGTDRGFSYPELESLFTNGATLRDDATSLQSNIERLVMQRVDLVLAVDLTFAYLQQQQNIPGLLADPLWSDAVGVYCAVNPHNASRSQLIRHTLATMVADGSITAILQRYRPANFLINQ